MKYFGIGSNTNLRLFVWFVFFVVIIFNSFTQTTSFPRIEPDPAAFKYHETAKSNYTWLELAEISLWASGCTGNVLQTNLAKINDITNVLLALNDLPKDEKEKAEFILNYLHKNILRSYSIYQTRIDTIFTNGRYNCVSSAVLYTILCKAAGIEVLPVITRDHAFVMVRINNENIDVETTNRYGFDPGNRKEFFDQFGKVTGFSYVPQQNYRDRQTISRIELVSLILNNRISDHERLGRYAESVPLAFDRAALLLGPDYSSPLNITRSVTGNNSLQKDPYSEITDRLFNYGAMLLRNSREEDAIKWANLMSEKYKEPDRWQEFYMAAINNRVSGFLRARKVTEARNFFDNQKHLLKEEYSNQLDKILLDARAAEYHNRFATAWNRRNYDEAERILNEGLKEFPDNRQLLNDKTVMERHRERN